MQNTTGRSTWADPRAVDPDLGRGLGFRVTCRVLRAARSKWWLASGKQLANENMMCLFRLTSFGLGLHKNSFLLWLHEGYRGM